MAVRYFYVDSNNGTNDGLGDLDTSYSIKKVGLMSDLPAGDVYTTLQATLILTIPPVDGDFILFADNHAAVYAIAASATLINANGTAAGIGVILASVDRNAIDLYKPGASEELTSSTAFNFKRSCLISGINLKTQYRSVSTAASGDMCFLKDCTVYSGNSSSLSAIYCADFDGAHIHATNVNISNYYINSRAITTASGGKFTWIGGKFLGSSPTQLIYPLGTNGGATVIIKGVDLSLLTTKFIPVNSNLASDNVYVKIEDCEINSGVSMPVPGTDLTSLTQRFEMFRCDDSTGKALHRFYVADGAGLAKNNDSVYVTANQAWYDGTAKSSIKVETSPVAGKVTPFIFELPAQYANLALTSEDKITVNLVTDASLTDTDIAAFLIYPDGTTAVAPIHITSGKTVGTGNYGIDPLAAGTALTNTGGLAIGDWTGAAGLTPYTLVLDTNATGQAGIVSVRVELYTDFTTLSKVLYIDSELAIGA